MARSDVERELTMSAGPRDLDAPSWEGPQHTEQQTHPSLHRQGSRAGTGAQDLRPYTQSLAIWVIPRPAEGTLSPRCWRWPQAP